ncbi:MAG: hypothetical protein ACTSRG_17935 [Candidatus Helarchaeota archaeon]
MNVKVKLTKLDYLRELSSQMAIAEAAKRQERLKIQKARQIGAKLQETGDLTQLRKLVQDLGPDFEWEETTSRWLKDSKPYDFVCVNMRMAGLDLKKERYSFWGIMSFSKAPVQTFDHLGDLERVIFEKDENNHFTAYSTIIHGVLDQLPEKIGDYKDINEVLVDPNITFMFEPGDHSIYVDKAKLRVKTLGIYIPDNFFIIRKLLAFQDNILIKIPCITHQHLEDVLRINLYEYTKLIVELDTLIQMQWKSKPLKERIKGFFKEVGAKIRFKKLEKTYEDYLIHLYNVLWRVPISNQARYLKILGKLFREGYENRKILINLEPMISKIIFALEEMTQQIQFLSWQSFSNSEKYLKKIIRADIQGLGKTAAESIPVAIEKIFTKCLDDICYPEKGTARYKIQRLSFWGGGHGYRILSLILQRVKNSVSKMKILFIRLYYKIRKREYVEEQKQKPEELVQARLLLENNDDSGNSGK